MIEYDFTEAGINNMYEATIADAIELSSARKYYEIANIVVTIGEHSITVPNNADFIEILFGALGEMKETE